MAIPKFMDAYNTYLMTKEKKAVANRLDNHWGMSSKDAAECVACGHCEEQCTQHLPIIERLREIAKM